MQAVILAAGMGSRLNPVTGGGSKALVEIGGRPLLLHQLETLADHGIGPVLVVLGHDADNLRAVIGDRAQVIVNERYAETNSLYSLWMARDWITGPFLLMNCDLFMDPRILDSVLDQPGTCLAYDSTSSRGREQTKVAVQKGKVTDLGKDLPRLSARGESLGLLKFDAAGSRAMLETADHLIGEGMENAWVIEASRNVCQQVPMHAVNVAGQAWTEIDFPYDLDVARREVWPVIDKQRFRTTRVWKRARIGAVAVVAGVLAMAGWVSNSKLGPASMDWETIDLNGGRQVRVIDGANDRKWWHLGIGERVEATVQGGEVRVYARLAQPADSNARGRFVMAVELDGRPVDWRTLTSRGDTVVRLDSLTFGTRDKFELIIPAGEHRLALTPIAGHGQQILLRVRQPSTVDE